jgi:hypothetical protein
MKKTIIYTLLAGLFILNGCDPNKDLYQQLDELQPPYHKSIEYTLTDADYSSVGGAVGSNKAFSEEHPAMNYVPAMLGRKFLALNEGSSAMVTYNYLEKEPVWEQAGFGYLLTEADYAYIGAGTSFNENNPAHHFLPFFLRKKYPNATQGTKKNIIYNFSVPGETLLYVDTYELQSGVWVLKETLEDVPYAGHEFGPDDYAQFGGNVGRYNNFSDADPANLHVPVWLRNRFPFAIEGREQVVRYKVFSGGTFDEIAHYTFDGLTWVKSSPIEVRSEQYVFGSQGWAFDPTTTFLMLYDDYMYLVAIDDIPHPTFNDFGYYYGSSAFYRNFDMRLEARRIQKDGDGNYRDPALGAIFESDGREAAVAEMYRRLVEEGFIALLQYKYPEAQPQIGGIEVHYILRFETFNDNLSRSYLEVEYRCISAGSGATPPGFELVDGPRDR